MIGVEGLAERLHNQNTSALIEGVGLMLGLLSESLRYGLTIVENAGPIQKAVQMATERIKGALTDQFVEICDPGRQWLNSSRRNGNIYPSKSDLM
jgi:hypothetical protein